MSRKNKDKNQYGSFVTAKTGYKKYIRLLVTALIVVIFIFAGKILWSKNHKPVSLAQTQSAPAADQIPGWWYQQYFGKSTCENSVCQPTADPDHDGLTNQQEYYYHTNPLKAYTVGDKLNDGQLVAGGFDPSQPGHVGFDQVGTDESILGESLVFNSDIEKLINESSNPQNLQLPKVDPSQLKITKDSSPAAFKKYLSDVQAIYDKYFPKNVSQFISDAIASGDDNRLSDLQHRLSETEGDLKQITVPQEFLQLHIYTIQFLDLLPAVIDPPAHESLLDETNPQANAWYDKTQAALSVYQKLTLENKRLEDKYK